MGHPHRLNETSFLETDFHSFSSVLFLASKAGMHERESQENKGDSHLLKLSQLSVLLRKLKWIYGDIWEQIVEGQTLLCFRISFIRDEFKVIFCLGCYFLKFTYVAR